MAKRKRRRGLGDSETCPRLEYESTVKSFRDGGDVIDVFAWLDGRAVGEVTAIHLTRNPYVYVSHSKVSSQLQRCGVGTRLYEEAARAACKDIGKPLASDKLRSAFSHGFWDKQKSKGRATCMRPMKSDVDSPRSGVKPENAVAGRGGCERFVLTCPAPRSLALAGARKRK